MDALQLLKQISKPRIVDLLRLSDKERWCSPRIRYASIRSKGELIADIIRHFDLSSNKEGIIQIKLKNRKKRFPDLRFDLQRRQYILNGEYFDSDRASRERPSFQIRRGPVTLQFGQLQLGPHGRSTVSAFFGASP